MSSPKKDPVETALSTILDALAAALIQLDVTPARVSQLARTAFVKVGAMHARKSSSGRPHLAKIAAITGLSRSEVKRIVSTEYATSPRSPEDSPRAMRVLRGWQTSQEYSRQGKPRILRVTGKRPSFESLCKAFSGDIPTRVILDELERRQRITFSRGRRWVSVCRVSRTDPKSQRTQMALAFAAAFLSESLQLDSVVLKRKERISTTRELPDGYVESAVVDRFSDLLNDISRPYVGKGKTPRHILNAYMLVSRATVNPARRKGS
jgi:hypothetical protein